MTPPTIAEIEKRLKLVVGLGAPWQAQYGNHKSEIGYVFDCTGAEIAVCYFDERNDQAEFIANAPTDIASLLSKLRECVPSLELHRDNLSRQIEHIEMCGDLKLVPSLRKESEKVLSLIASIGTEEE